MNSKQDWDRIKNEFSDGEEFTGQATPEVFLCLKSLHDELMAHKDTTLTTEESAAFFAIPMEVFETTEELIKRARELRTERKSICVLNKE